MSTGNKVPLTNKDVLSPLLIQCVSIGGVPWSDPDLLVDNLWLSRGF